MLQGFSAGSDSLSWESFVRQLVDQAGIVDEAVETTVLSAFLQVPRDLFLEPRYVAYANTDIALPCGFGEMMPKPSLLIRMASLVGLRKGLSVLDASTGSGYFAAVLARAGCQVFGVEPIGLLAQRTRRMLDLFSLERVLVKRGEVIKGWSEHGPYRSIVVTEPIFGEPSLLISQLLTPGGLLVGLVPCQSGFRISLWEARNSGCRQYLLESVAL